jgi:glyoxylase-like metal-dependent hydrolase (beta-lactamase superfamily II)
VSGHGSGWQEVGDRVFRFRYRSYDLNVGAVVGDDEVLVVDTRSFAAEAARLLADLRALTRLPCRQVVNTHAHFDHCFGNATLRPAAIWGHRRCAEQLRDAGEERRRKLMAAHPEVAEELAGVVLDPPDRPVGDAGAELVVGGRRVELRFCGRGHTDNDLVVVVPDAGVVFAGDLVEELAAMAALCRRVAAGELSADEAVGAAPFPAEFARDALALSARAAGPAGGAAPGTARPG